MSDSTVIVTTRAALDESVARAFERALTKLPREGEPAQPNRIGWLSNREAMAALDVSKATLARWRSDGTLAYSKVGASVYYAADDISALLESRRVRRAA